MQKERPTRNYKVSIKEVKEIRRMYAEGLSYEKISANIGKTYSAERSGGGQLYSQLLYKIARNNAYRDKEYIPPDRTRRELFASVRLPASECKHTCRICGMGYSLFKHEPFATQDSADDCCARLSLCNDRDVEREYRTDGDIIKRPLPDKRAARDGIIPCKCYLRLAR